MPERPFSPESITSPAAANPEADEHVRRYTAERQKLLKALNEHDAIEGMDKILQELERLRTEYFLLVHQTMADTAEKIVERDEYFSHSGLLGTALELNPDSIMKVIEAMQSDDPNVFRGKIHKGANAFLLMGVDRHDLAKAEGKPIEELRNITQVVDNVLLDRVDEGKLKQWGLPNRAIYGIYHEGRLYKNKRFDGKLEPTDLSRE